MVDKMAEVDIQYRNILQVNWKETAVFNEGIPTDAIQFGSGMAEYRNLLGEHAFEDLSQYALSCLTTPVRNAVVERIFSLVASVKTKPRNRMSSNLLESVVRIRSHLCYGERCCEDFVATPRTLALFNTETMYKANVTDIDETDIDGMVDLLDM